MTKNNTIGNNIATIAAQKKDLTLSMFGKPIIACGCGKSLYDNRETESYGC